MNIKKLKIKNLFISVLTLLLTSCCLIPDNKTETEPILPHEHLWDEGKVTIEPTCSEEGVKLYTCSICEKTKEEYIDTIEHKFNEEDLKCEICGYEQYENLIKFTERADGYYVSKNNIGTTSELFIPSKYNGKPVTGIDHFGFIDCEFLKEIHIPNSVNRIGTEAFNGCILIDSITIPENVTNIGESAFKNCSSLKEVTILSENVEIGNWAFSNCDSIISINISAHIVSAFSSNNLERIIINSGESIGSLALNGYTKLKEITLPDTLIEIGDFAFKECRSLENIYLPESLEKIGTNAFFSCRKLKSINIPKNVSKIGVGAFDYCESLESITVDENNPTYDSRGNCNAIIESSIDKLITGCKNTIIPNDIKIIGALSFARTSSANGILSNLIIPESVEVIEQSAFQGCGLINIYIPKNVSKIETGAFVYCESLESITVDENNPIYDSRDNSNAIIETATNKLITGCKNTIIPNDVKIIGKSSFEGCKELTNIEIPNTVEIIESFAFANCNLLNNITIPNILKEIGSTIFLNCESLEFNSYDMGLYLGSIENPYLILVKAKSKGILGTEINENTKFIMDSAFSGCEELKAITIPESVKSIGSFIFSGCNMLKNVTIGSNVETIGDYAFSGCSRLESITIPTKVKEINTGTFDRCYSLMKIGLSSNILKIGYNAFNECGSLTEIYYEGTMEQWKIIEIDQNGNNILNHVSVYENYYK